MFRIGEFSRFGRVTVKMLRHYDELGLLRPARIDPETGYRYYAADQLPRLNRIVALKELGFRLEQIGMMMDGDLTNEQLRGMLKLRRAELEREVADAAARLAQVDGRLAQLERAGSPPRYEVVVRSVPPQQVAAIRQSVSVDDAAITALFEELEAFVARYKARAPLPPLMIYHDAEYSDAAEDVEVLIPLERPLPPDERVVARELPGHPAMACLVHAGGYDGLAEAFSVLLGWIERHGYAVDGPTREVYLRFGADQIGYTLPDGYLAGSDEEYVTELQVPVARERGGGSGGMSRGLWRWI